MPAPHIRSQNIPVKAPCPPNGANWPAWKISTCGTHRLTGPLPPEWGQLTRLHWLYLSNNQLTGPLPIEWTRMTSLRSLGLQDNQLTGCFPYIFFRHVTYISKDLPSCGYPIYHESKG